MLLFFRFTHNDNPASHARLTPQIAFADQLSHLLMCAGVRNSQRFRNLLDRGWKSATVYDAADFLKCPALRIGNLEFGLTTRTYAPIVKVNQDKRKRPQPASKADRDACR